MEKDAWGKVVPCLWASVDAVSLTAVLWLDAAMPGALIASFPVLVALSGLWFRPPVVGVTTLLTMLGYSFLVLDNVFHRRPVEQLNWHVAFLVFLMLTGGAVAFQAHRVQALSRFYGRHL